MKDVTVLLVTLAALLGAVGGIKPSNGYCIGNQCFTVIQDPSDFTAAEQQCSEQSGHLMTVRSTVSHDILSILLGNITGRYWIGLHRPTGCPDSDAALRGYEWVTKDGESDFYNWATFDSSCESPRCVSVAQKEFKWMQEPCGEQAAGFFCEYTFQEPCKGLEAAAGESVSYRSHIGFEGEDLLSLPPGTIATRMPSETKLVCFSEKWLPAPWTCEIEEGGCEYKCVMSPKNEPTCFCPPGQVVNPANNVTCEAAKDDPCVQLRCQHACYKTGDVYACICDHGFNLAADGRSCVDFNDCKDERQCPGENFKCVNVVGGFRCVCKDGYRMTGDKCVDVDECVSAPCEHACDNTPGSYKCSCYDGYQEDPESPDKCRLYCGLEECPAECDPNDKFQCYCPVGYIAEERGDDTFCIDIDECSFYYCDQNCKNTFGSYVCSCSPKYTLVDEFKCVKTEDEDPDGGSEGSGATTVSSTLTPTPYEPEPTRRPSGVTAGGLVGIIVCTVFFIVLVVFLAHHFLSGRGKMESAAALKATEGEAHCLQQVTNDAC